MAAENEDCNDADLICIDPTFRLAIGKSYKEGVIRPMLSKLENEVSVTAAASQILEYAFMMSFGPLLGDNMSLAPRPDPAHCE